ncbi:MAG: mannosyl-3-phosphoglycerate phosphatase [Candidatus Altiarchaeota archaeon]|nr:mannosyl-3-phosphoglycerate phosphatase [Candidatus Altiarchaeota archaeon]
MSPIIVFTDLDGTLIDEDYSYKKALPAMESIKKKKIPLIFCTSKTRAEIEVYREELGVMDPFISENGGAVFIPEGYFCRKVGEKIKEGYEMIELGAPYPGLREVLDRARKASGCKIMGFGDMSVEELSKDSGLTLKTAELAKMREYDEPFRMEGTDEQKEKALNVIEAHGLNHTKGGRYYHILGENDKGKAVRTLTGLSRSKDPDIETVGLGDSENDFPMLDNVDVPILIKKSDGSFADYGKKAKRSKLPGPAGWNQVMLEMLL